MALGPLITSLASQILCQCNQKVEESNEPKKKEKLEKNFHVFLHTRPVLYKFDFTLLVPFPKYCHH